ncbi:hypothetical protein HNY73_008107 [Argiope bruennichi]|uniref:Uncharacterized protein n=1 Tax=Argiope bruennichi TaxID=94029 RepID=A0A8T0F5A8_ARGBR|nr:hypothetical protein HNY73_008107 [Argiope bruennichi]
MSKRPGGEPDDGAGGKKIHFADESIQGPEHLRLVRRMEDMEREIRALRSENKEKDALLEQYNERIHALNEENKDLYKRIKEKAINATDMGIQCNEQDLDIEVGTLAEIGIQADGAEIDAQADLPLQVQQIQAPPLSPPLAPPMSPPLAPPMSPPQPIQPPQVVLPQRRVQNRRVRLIF